MSVSVNKTIHEFPLGSFAVGLFESTGKTLGIAAYDFLPRPRTIL